MSTNEHDAPTATPSRDEVREERRFRAAVAAMQGMLASGKWGGYDEKARAKGAVQEADALLAELDRTGAGK